MLAVYVIESQYAPSCLNTNGDSVAAHGGCFGAPGVRRAKRTKRQFSRSSDTQTLIAPSCPRLPVLYSSHVSSSSRRIIPSRITEPTGAPTTVAGTSCQWSSFGSSEIAACSRSGP